MKLKKKDWMKSVTKKLLIEELENYYIDYQLDFYGGWTEKDIKSFLHLNFHLVRKRITPDHVKQVTQLIKEMIT